MIVLVVRTRRPFFRSRPARPLLLSTLLVVGLTVLLPYSPLAPSLGFGPLPAGFLLAPAFIVVLYVAAAEAAKAVFYRREAALSELSPGVPIRARSLSTFGQGQPPFGARTSPPLVVGDPAGHVLRIHVHGVRRQAGKEVSERPPQTEHDPSDRRTIMAQMMKSFVMKGIGEVGFVDKPVPEPGPNDAVVKTTRALVCTSDAHTLRGAIGDRKDLTLGHEAVGVVAKLGSEVKGFQDGDRVLVGAITPDFACENCQRGYTSQCRHMLGGWRFANVKDGVFAEYFHVNDARGQPDADPGDDPRRGGGLLRRHALHRLHGGRARRHPARRHGGVFAQGPVGLMATVGARLLGAGLVIAVEGDPQAAGTGAAFRGRRGRGPLPGRSGRGDPRG